MAIGFSLRTAYDRAASVLQTSFDWEILVISGRAGARRKM
jgi:hypothetical protein